MAKLIGVTTIDMANGEITKVAYGGAEYAKVSGAPSEEVKIGDIALCSDTRTKYFSKGSYYIAEERGVKNVLFGDNLHGRTAFSNMDERVTLFRKTPAQASPTNTDASIADVSAKVDAIDARVTALEKSDVPKPADSITHKDVEYTLVDRRAQEGDVVVFTENEYVHLENDKPYKVTEEGVIEDREGDSAEVYNAYNNRNKSNVLVYAPKVEPLKVGDYAKVTNSYGDSFVGIGDVCEVIYDDTHEPRFKLKRVVDGMDSGFMYEDGLVKATDEEVADAKALAEQSAKDAKLAQVFTQAGRKPNEYRKGDIVRISESYRGFSVNKAGDIGVVETVAYFDSFRVVVDGRVGTGNHHSPKNVEIVTFAESRLDRN